MALLRPVALAPSGSQGTISQRFDGQFSWEPAGYLRRIFPLRGKRTKWIRDAIYYLHLHLAIDYICPVGTPVRAVKSGVIIGQGRNPFDGAEMLYLRIRRGARYDVTFLYYHLKAGSYRYRNGAAVARGITIVLSGATGWVTGPHLHVELIRSRRGAPITEIYQDGLRVDPQPYINGTARLRDLAP